MKALSDAAVEAAVLGLVRERGSAATACPSEVARALAPDGWRPLMQRVREVASVLAERGEIEITQGGRAVPPCGPWKGPIRLRLPKAPAE